MIGVIVKEEKIQFIEVEVKECCDEFCQEFKGEKIDEFWLVNFVESFFIESKVLDLFKEWVDVELLLEGSFSQIEEDIFDDDVEEEVIVDVEVIFDEE